MEMLTDPMLKQWVPAWVNEQYERANPFFREVLTALLEREWEVEADKNVNDILLRSTKVDMIRRHHRQMAKDVAKKGTREGAREETW